MTKNAPPPFGYPDGPRCVHLSTVHRGDDVRVFHKECMSLAHHGLDVHLIAQPPLDASHSRDEGVVLHALSPPARRLARVTQTLGELRRRALHLDAALYHFHDPELIPFAIELKIRGKVVIYDVHEDYRRQVSSKTWIPGALRSLVGTAVGASERTTHGIFDAFVVATPDIAAHFPARKTHVIANFPVIGELAQIGKHPYEMRAPTFAYVGAVYPERGTQQMFDATRLVASERSASLTIAGKGADSDTTALLARMNEAAFVDYLGWQTREQVSQLLGRARAGLVVLQPEERFKTSYPVKMFEYMAAGLPVIASDFPLWRQILDAEDCGILVDPTDPKDIAEAMLWILGNPEEAEGMGQRGRAAVLEKYNWEREGQKLVRLYDEILGQAGDLR